MAWSLPLLSWRVSSPWGPRSRGFHRGIDLAAPTGTPIHSVAAGTVQRIWVDNGNPKDPDNVNGNAIRVLHFDGTGAGYAHLHTIAPGLQKGAKVSRGQRLGTVGSTGRSTGPHLHLTAFDGNGVRVNPARFLPGIFRPAERQAGIVAGALVLLGIVGAVSAAFAGQRRKE